MSLNVSDQECNSGKKYGQKGTLCGPNINEWERKQDHSEIFSCLESLKIA